MAELNKDYVAKVQAATMAGIVEASIVEHDGLRVAHLHSPEVVDALATIVASMIASAPDAKTTEGTRRLVRRLARDVERKALEFQRHTAQHGSPFEVAQ